ncbi:MAG: hypothetical protein F6K14_34275 [Symploca sp. SIO2C1]|nr:hypothetical protein [Symploca sp. SIO2C1]
MSVPTLPTSKFCSAIPTNPKTVEFLAPQGINLQRQARQPIAPAVVADFKAIFERDPAASNWLEVLLCYPGLHALAGYRLAHWLHQRRLPLLPRLISHIIRWLTGIEIHPGAQIGRGVLTLPRLRYAKTVGFFCHRERNRFTLRKHLHRMPYGCKSSY